MDQQQADGWEMPPWAEDTIDPLWFSDFPAIDPTQDFAYFDPAMSGVSTTTATNLPFESASLDVFSSQPSSALPSPDCALDPASCQAMARYERSLEQRPHTLPRRRSKYVLRRSGSRSSPIAIPSGSSSLAMQRWQNSPPEDEAASLSAICNALESEPSSISANTHSNVYRHNRGPSSTTSLDSGASGSSLHSGSSTHSAASLSRQHNRITKVRTRTKGRGKNMDTPDRIFKCTFCCDTFKHKHDWSRHEKSLHLNMEEWLCTPFGSSVVLPLTGRVHCAYCSALDPTPEHLQQHNHSACLEGPPRVFRRKDHLVQHLRLVHRLDTLPLIEDWKVESMPVVARCGFCNANLESWDERIDHLAAHFREGKTMVDWQGDHGFHPSVNARLSNAFPPYLLHAQSITLVPFSATNPAAIDHYSQLLSRIELEEKAAEATASPLGQQTSVLPTLDTSPTPTQQEMDTAVFADILTRHLSRFARQQVLMGVMPTDEMFQKESRRLLYHDADDDWNQTVADDPKWMQEFRQRTGFGGKPGL